MKTAHVTNPKSPAGEKIPPKPSRSIGGKVYESDLAVLHAAINHTRARSFITYDKWDDYEPDWSKIEPVFIDPSFTVVKSDLSCSEPQYLDALTARFAQIQKIELRWFYHRDDTYLIFMFNLNP